MFNSDEPDDKREQGTLTVNAPLGVEIEVCDSRFRALVVGSAPLSLPLSPGIYNVVWRAGGRSEERLVRIRAGATSQIVGGEFPLGSAPPSGFASSSQLEKKQLEATTKAVKSQITDARSEILVIIRSSNERPTGDLGRSIRLANPSGIDMRSDDSEDSILSDPSNQLAVRSYRVPPGPYLLRYEANDRRTLEQTVYAFESRKSVVFLKYGSLMIHENMRNKVKMTPRRGIDPTQTTVVSIPIEADGSGLEESTRIADILLHKLSSSEKFFDPALLELVKSKSTDPFLKLYAAALMLEGQTNGNQYSADLPKQAHSPRAILNLLKQIPANDFPDTLCLGWSLDAMRKPSGSTGLQAKLTIPPMLDICWRWASAHSVLNPEAIEDTAALTAAARITQGTPPWLVWKALSDSARSDYKRVEKTLPEDTQVAELVQMVASAAKQNSERFVSEGADKGSRPRLTLATVEFANAATSLVSSEEISDPLSIAQNFAFSTGTPRADLMPQLDEALQELRSGYSED